MHRFNEKAEQWIDKVVPVHNHGFIQLVDYMGNDERIAEAARQSTTGDTKGPEADRNLIRYMLDCSHPPHSSPFEMVETTWKIRMPIFVARQWVRHRTASLNEYSGRYSVMPEEVYVPTADRVKRGGQDTVNPQGSIAADLTDIQANVIRETMEIEQRNVFEQYYKYVNNWELAKELARINLPLSTYTTWMWKIDLHNLFHFLGLRMDGHAQEEIRVYADEMFKVVRDIAPMAAEAFWDFKLHAKTLSRMQITELMEAARNDKDTKLATQIFRILGDAEEESLELAYALLEKR